MSRPTEPSLPDALTRAKLLAFSDSIRDMESLGRDFNEPEERLGLQSAIVHTLESAGGALTLAELHRRIVAWQESGPTFATTVTDTYWGQRLLANELIPGQYRAVPALPRHGIAGVRLLAEPETLSEEGIELLAELARNNHQRQDTLRRQPAYDRGHPYLEQRGLVARHVDDEWGEVYVYLNPARVEVSLVGPERPMAYDGTRRRFVTQLARQVGLARGDCSDFHVPWTERTGLERRDVFSQLAFRLSVLREPLRLEGEVYRGATDKVERRKLEADFRGTPRPNFLSTGPAMEVGIDIGDLNALLLFGTPPNINAYLQRVGRAGRSEKRSLVISVSKTNPIDYYYYERPRELIASRPEPVPLNEHNEEVLRISLTWALQDWIAAHFWIPWQRQQITATDGHMETVIVAQGPEMRIDERPQRPPEVYRWSSVYYRPAQQIDLGGALAPLAWLAGPDSLYAPEPRRWLEDILGYRFCAHCGCKFAADARDLCHGERPALAAEVFSGLIDDAIAGFQERLLAFLYRDVEAIDGEIDALSAQLQEMGRRTSPFAQRTMPQVQGVPPFARDTHQAADPGFVYRRAEVERALERLINYKQRVQRSRFAEAHAHSVEAKHAYSLRGTGDRAEVITWRPAGEDVLMREARDMAMAMIDHHPYGVFVQGNRTYVASRIEWESLPDLWQRKDMGSAAGACALGTCLCGRAEIDAQGVCPACGTRYVGLRKVHLYPHTARLAVAPGRERRAQPRDVHWRPSGADATNSHADIQARILPGGFRPQAGSSLELVGQTDAGLYAAPSPRPRGRSTYGTELPAQPGGGAITGELSYGDLDLALLSRRYVAYYGDGGVDPLPRPYELCGECGGVLVHEGGQPVHCLFDAGHDMGQRVQVGLVNVLRTKGLRLAVAGSLALAHSLAHGLRLALQKIAGVDVRSIGEVVIGPVPGAGVPRPYGHNTVGAGYSRPPVCEIYLYDTAPGGSGACQLLVARDEAGRAINYVEAVRVIRERVEACDCEVACPKCLMQYGCALDNRLRTLSRGEVVGFLKGDADAGGAWFSA